MDIQRIFGILGDSFNFFGSILLAWDNLSRRRTWAKKTNSLKSAAIFRRSGLRLNGPDGKPLTEESITHREVESATKQALLGTGMLVVGFSILLILKFVS